VIFLLFLAATHTYSEFSLKYTGDRPRQPAYEIARFQGGTQTDAVARLMSISSDFLFW